MALPTRVHNKTELRPGDHGAHMGQQRVEGKPGPTTNVHIGRSVALLQEWDRMTIDVSVNATVQQEVKLTQQHLRCLHQR